MQYQIFKHFYWDKYIYEILKSLHFSSAGDGTESIKTSVTALHICTKYVSP